MTSVNFSSSPGSFRLQSTLGGKRKPKTRRKTMAKHPGQVNTSYSPKKDAKKSTNPISQRFRRNAIKGQKAGRGSPTPKRGR